MSVFSLQFAPHWSQAVFPPSLFLSRRRFLIGKVESVNEQ